MLQSFKDLDFTQCGDRHALFLVVHQNTFEGNNGFRVLVDSLMNFAVKE
jgi:hypothetical protein